MKCQTQLGPHPLLYNLLQCSQISKLAITKKLRDGQQQRLCIYYKPSLYPIFHHWKYFGGLKTKLKYVFMFVYRSQMMIFATAPNGKDSDHTRSNCKLQSQAKETCFQNIHFKNLLSLFLPFNQLLSKFTAQKFVAIRK